MKAVNFKRGCLEYLRIDPAKMEQLFDDDERVEPEFKKEPLRGKVLNCYAAGTWLGRVLRDAGLSEEEARNACFAAGQMMATMPDPWAIAEFHRKAAIEDNTLITPGKGLANALLEGRRTVPATKRQEPTEGNHHER